MEVNGIFIQIKKIIVLVVTFLSVSLFTGCGNVSENDDLDMSIESINISAYELVDSKIKTQGVVLIFPDLRLFQDESIKNSLGEERMRLSIPINMDFDYDEIKKLDCYGKKVGVEAYVLHDEDLREFYLGREVKLINPDGSVCHIFPME